MSNDYTPRKEEGEAFALPPVPATERFLWNGADGYDEDQLLSYGHACAEAARAPLVEENARLLARVAESDDYVREANKLLDEFSSERDRLRAEVEALRNKSRAFRNQLVSALADTATGEYELRVATAEAAVNEFEDAIDAAIAARKGTTKEPTSE